MPMPMLNEGKGLPIGAGILHTNSLVLGRASSADAIIIKVPGLRRIENRGPLWNF